MAEEGDEVLEKALVWIQKQQEKLREGFSVWYRGGEYTFAPKYIDRQVFGELTRPSQRSELGL